MAISITDAVSGATSSISALAGATTSINSLKNLLSATPQTQFTQGYQPQNPFLPGGQPSLATPPPALLFHYEGEQTCTFASDITDHFTENNTSLQDQISIKPIMITTHGFIGELNNIPPPGLATLGKVQNTLTSIGSYVPGLSSTAQLAYNEAFAAYQLAASATNSAVSAISSLNPSAGGESVIGSTGLKKQSNQNNQQTYFQQFYGYWYNRILFTVQTPWAVFQNMAILTFRAIQDAETRMISDFEVTFKQINFASTTLLSAQQVAQNQLITQSAALTTSGVTASNPASTSFGSALLGQLGIH